MRHYGQFLFQRVESALHAFRLFKYVAAYETPTMFMGPCASSCGCGARFDFVYEPGRCCACRLGIERWTIHRIVVIGNTQVDEARQTGHNCLPQVDAKVLRPQAFSRIARRLNRTLKQAFAQ